MDNQATVSLMGRAFLLVIALTSSRCCPSVGVSDCFYLPLTIDGCPLEPVPIGDSFELTVSAADGRPAVYDWSVLTEEGRQRVPNEEVEITDIDGGISMATIAVFPKQVGTTTLTVFIFTFDSTNLAAPPTCTFEAIIN